MFFFPFATDAPIYHWPIVTVLLIIVNTAMFFATGAGLPGSRDSALILHYQHINPVEWITCNFMHADYSHLIGNMLFLWPFGLLAEGKLGWYRFLAVYLGIGAVYGMLIQSSMYVLGTHGGALGASAAIFGLIALALVWAPRNELSIAYLIMVGFRYKAGVYEVSVLAFSGCYVAVQAVLFGIGGFHISTAGLHLTGFAVGFPLGLLMLKRKWVDCEGWDLLSTWGTGKPVEKDAKMLRKEADELAQKVEQREAEDDRRQQTAAIELLHSHIAEGRAKVAYAVYRKHSGHGAGDWELPEPILLQFAEALRRERMWIELIPLLREIIARFPHHAAGARLKLAHILIEVENRPRQALSVLEKLPAELPETQSTRRRQLQALAKKAIDEGEMEMAIEEW